MKNQNCKTCQKDFQIRDEDLVFYEQMKSPPPLHCPDCRMMRRLAFRNERTLYKRPCDLCKTDGISLYPPGTPFPVYCHKCWWSDKWDAASFAQEYDKSRPFFEQFKELQNKVPRIGLLVINSVRSDYTNNAEDNKDCYLMFAAGNCEDCLYGRLVQHSKNCVDCAFVYDSELCYECVDCRSCFKCFYSEECQSSSDLLFCYNMRDSQNCILCTNGRHLSYAILNVKYSKEEYEKKKEEIFSSYESIEKAKKQFEELKSESLVKYASQTKCNNATGNYMFNCHDGIRIFDASNTKNCSYVADAEDPTDCFDCNNFYEKPEFCLDMMGILKCSKSKHSFYIMYCNECEYCDSCYHSNNCFGCIRLNKGKYSILNKEYSKEEYEKLKNEIVESMKQDGTYGQFFPPELSPFGYNETLAKEYFKMGRDEALAKGFRWQEQVTGTFGKETIAEKDMPQTIEQVTEAALSDIFACKECGKNFRLTKAELEFYQRMHLPIPHKDFECRHQDRMGKRNPRKLWHRSCMCDKKHINHEENCSNEFETSYSPERKEIVYCEQCYQQEVS